MTTDEKPAEPRRAELRLRLTHSRGHARDGACAFPIEGAGMANALELDGSRPSHAQWHGANLCRISCQSGGWQLQNRNPKLVCALNGQRLTLDVAMPLSVGDVIEVGLMRFVVEAIVTVTRSAAADARPHAPPGAEPGAPEERADSAAASAGGDGRRALSDAAVAGPPARGTNAAPGNTAFDDGRFNLRDLASPAPDGSGGHAWLSSRSDSPFGVLDIVGAEYAPASDVLAGMLAEPSPPGAVGRFPESPQQQVSDPASAGVDGTPVTPPATEPNDHSAMSPDASSALSQNAHHVPEGVLQALHQEFVRVVRDPTLLTGRVEWDAALAPGDLPAPGLEELSQQADRFALLRDIVLPLSHIDDVIGDLDPLRQSTLLQEQAAEDVLHLFAPQMARAAKPTLPGLTQREHHALSPDSHMRLGAFSPERPPADRTHEPPL